MKKIRLLLADDHAILRAGLRVCNICQDRSRSSRAALMTGWRVV